MSPLPDPPERVRTLLALYRESNYDVEGLAAAPLTLRIGAPAPAAIVAWCAGDVGCFLTASNPRSQALTDAENLRHCDALRGDLLALHARVLPGVGYMPGERWREPSLFAAGVPLPAVDALMRRYDQNSILVLRGAAAIRLRVYRAEWRALAEGAADLEWAGPA